GHPVEGQTAERRQCLDTFVGGASAHHVQDDVHPAALVGLDQGGGHVRGGGVHRAVRAQLTGELTLFFTAGHGNDPPGTELLGELDGECAHATRGGVHDDGFSGLHPGGLAQKNPGGVALDKERERGLVGDLGGDVEGEVGVDQGSFGVPAPAVEHAQEATPVGGAAGDLATGDHWQGRG